MEACKINIPSSTYIMKNDKHISYMLYVDQIKEITMLLFVFCKRKSSGAKVAETFFGFINDV